MSKSVHVNCDGLNFLHKVDSRLTEKLNTSHCHDTYEILYVQQGNGRYLIEGAELLMQPRTLVLFRPFEYHCVEVEQESIYDRYIINFSKSALPREALGLLEEMLGSNNEEISGRYYLPEALSQTTVSVFDRMEYALSLSERERTIYIKLLLSELLVLLSGVKSQHIAHDEDELGARVAKYINDYLESDISLDKLAKNFFVSKYYLCRSFKKYSGVSVHAYINNKRVLYAKQLIDSGETASGAAYRVGFGDYSAFYRAYIKIIGNPPTAKSKKRDV